MVSFARHSLMQNLHIHIKIMSIYVYCICTYIYTYVHTCVHTCIYVRIYPHIHMYLIYIHIISQVPETLVTLGIGVDATLNLPLEMLFLRCVVHRSAAQGGFWMGGRRTLHAAAEQHEASWSQNGKHCAMVP